MNASYPARLPDGKLSQPILAIFGASGEGRRAADGPRASSTARPIRDEDDLPEPAPARQEDGSWIVPARWRIDEVADATGLAITTPDVDLAVTTLRAAGIAAYPDDADGPAVVVPTGEPPEVIALLVRAGVAVHEARRRRTNLDELFARLTEESA